MRTFLIALITGASLGSVAPQLAAETNDSGVTESTSPPRTVFRYGQRSPTRDRYREIQTALKEHGFDPGPIDGQWGPQTAAALKRFEKANNLRADGRLDSLALIVLGLGPKRLSSIAKNSE